jgi:tetratricopeptide (TPR) repeat protein
VLGPGLVTKIAVILLAVTTIIAGVCLGEAETPSRTQPPPSPYRTLLPFETTPHAISLSRGEAQTLTPSGFGHVVSLLQNDKPVEALDRALLMAIHQPSLWRQRTFQLLIAECYFILGGDDPTLQFAYAKPLYERLLRFYPRWENQPLILFRLATIEERQGLTIEARAAYGVLVDWYPDDPLAESARLGLVMSGLRVDDLHDAEGQAQNVLDTAKDAQIRYHAAVCLGIIYHRLGRPADALSDFEKVVHWPADQDLLEDFELFGLGETFLDNQRFSEATQAFLTYLKRFPAGADRPMAIYDVATEAHRLGQEDEAVLGYRYLIDHYPLLYAGVKSELQLALLMMQVQPGQANPTTELLLRNVRDQNDFRDLNQKGGLELALYEINVGRPIEAMGELTDIIDRPLDPVDKPAAAQRMLQAFQNVLAANLANPMLLAKVFREFRPYVDSAGLPVESYVDLGEALYQNLQADTLLAISHNNPLAQAYPRQAMFLTAEGRRLRGEYDQAKVELARLLDIPLKPEPCDCSR